MGRILITTGLKFKNNFELGELLFLGDWCIENNVNTNYSDVINYHWQDRKKLFEDYKN